MSELRSVDCNHNVMWHYAIFSSIFILSPLAHLLWMLWETSVTGWSGLISLGWSVVHLHLAGLCDITSTRHCLSSMESLRGAGKRWENEELGLGGWGEREERGRRRMYPQPSCSVSNMALVPLRKKREIEQINTDHQIPPISFTSPPTWIKAQGGCGWGLHTYINTYVCAHMVSLFRCCVYMHVLPLKKKISY